MAGDVLELAGFEVLYLGEDVSSDDFVILAVSSSPFPTPSRWRSLRRPPKALAEGALIAELRLLASPMSRSSSADRALPAAGRAPDGNSRGPRTPPSCPPSWTAWSPGARWRPGRGGPIRPRCCRRRVAAVRETLPEDRLLEIAAESAEAARAHARVANAYRRLAFEDPLTGVPNRRAFDERIAQLTG